MTDEMCDKCGTVVTEFKDGVLGPIKTPKLKHFHAEGNHTICLGCSGVSPADWDTARQATDPKYITPDSLNASWPKDKPWPLDSGTEPEVSPKPTRVTGPHYHLPPDGKRVVTLAESGRSSEQYVADKQVSNPKFQTEGKDHADWPANVALPDPSVIYDETGIRGGKKE